MIIMKKLAIKTEHPRFQVETDPYTLYFLLDKS